MKKTTYTDLGRKAYTETWALQRELLERVRAGKKSGRREQNHLLFVEHPPVYTLGKSGDEANMLADMLRLQAKQAEFIKVDRGGDITYHGPGQLVAYPIIDLEGFGLGVKEYVYRLEEVVIRALGTFGIAGERLEGAAGVWIAPGTPAVRKICAIGVKCAGYVTMHGFALNVSTDPDYFTCINPCGFTDKGVTSVEIETGKKTTLATVKEAVLQQFREVFGMEFE